MDVHIAQQNNYPNLNHESSLKRGGLQVQHERKNCRAKQLPNFKQ